MLKTQQLTVALVAALSGAYGLEPLAHATGNREDAILGYWQRGEREAIVEIRRQADHYQGIVVASEQHPEIIGAEIFKSLKYDHEHRRWRGRVYSIARDRDFDTDMVLRDSEHFVISLRVFFIRKSVEFHRQPSP